MRPGTQRPSSAIESDTQESGSVGLDSTGGTSSTAKRGRGRGRGRSSARGGRGRDKLQGNSTSITAAGGPSIAVHDSPLTKKTASIKPFSSGKQRKKRKQRDEEDEDDGDDDFQPMSDVTSEGEEQDAAGGSASEVESVGITDSVPVTPASSRRRSANRNEQINLPMETETDDATYITSEYQTLKTKIVEALKVRVLVRLTPARLERNRTTQPITTPSRPTEKRGKRRATTSADTTPTPKPRGRKKGPHPSSVETTPVAIDNQACHGSQQDDTDATSLSAPLGASGNTLAASDSGDRPLGTGKLATEGSSDAQEADSEDYPLIFQVTQNAERYKCILPICSKDFLNIQGLRYHLGNHVHEILEILSWAYPSTEGSNQSADAPTRALGASSTTLQEQQTVENAESQGESSERPSTVRPDILALHDQIPLEAWPMNIDEFDMLLPGQGKPTPINTFLIGLGRNREMAERRRLRAIFEQEKQQKREQLIEGRRLEKEEKQQEQKREKEKAKAEVKSAVRQRGYRTEYSTVPLPSIMRTAEHSGDFLKVFSGARPRVEEFEIVDPDTASMHIPQAPRVSVVAAGIDGTAEEPTTIETLHAASLPNNVCKRKRYVLNTGGSVWGLDWCPIPVRDGAPQYLAVGGYKGTIDEHHVIGVRQDPKSGADMKGCIQIWRSGPLNDGDRTNQSSEVNPVLSMCLLHDYGRLFDLKWAPWGYFESKDTARSADELPRLGLLAATFGDGNMRVFNIPHPDSLIEHPQSDAVLYVRAPPPLLEASLPDTLLWKLAWGGYGRLATGCTNGSIAVWDISDTLSQQVKERKGKGKRSEPSNMDDAQNTHVEPLSYFPAHDSCIQNIDWTGSRLYPFSDNPPPPPSWLVTCSNDGRLMVRDVRDPWIGGMLYRVRAFMQCCAYMPEEHAILFVDADNGVRFLRPGDEDPKGGHGHVKKDDDEGAGMYVPQRTVGLTSHPAGVWCVNASHYCSFVASSSADGTVKISNLRRMNSRSYKVTQVNLYRLQYDYKTQVFTYVENTKPEELATVSLRGSAPLLMPFFAPEVAIQRVAWNPNQYAASWIASGGTNGMVRLETTFGLDSSR